MTKIIIKSPDDNGGDGKCALNILLPKLNSIIAYLGNLMFFGMFDFCFFSLECLFAYF